MAVVALLAKEAFFDESLILPEIRDALNLPLAFSPTKGLAHSAQGSIFFKSSNTSVRSEFIFLPTNHQLFYQIEFFNIPIFIYIHLFFLTYQLTNLSIYYFQSMPIPIN